MYFYSLLFIYAYAVYIKWSGGRQLIIGRPNHEAAAHERCFIGVWCWLPALCVCCAATVIRAAVRADQQVHDRDAIWK